MAQLYCNKTVGLYVGHCLWSSEYHDCFRQWGNIIPGICERSYLSDTKTTKPDVKTSLKLLRVEQSCCLCAIAPTYTIHQSSEDHTGHRRTARGYIITLLLCCKPYRRPTTSGELTTPPCSHVNSGLLCWTIIVTSSKSLTTGTPCTSSSS